MFDVPQAGAADNIVHNTAWDGTARQIWHAETNGSNVTIVNPSALLEGRKYEFRFTHTTAHAFAFGSAFKGDIANRMPAPVVGAVHYAVFEAVGGLLYLTGDPSANAAA